MKISSLNKILFGLGGISSVGTFFSLVSLKSELTWGIALSALGMLVAYMIIVYKLIGELLKNDEPS